MQITLDGKDRIFINHETAFEESFLQKLIGKKFEVRESTGVSIGDFLGVTLKEIDKKE